MYAERRGCKNNNLKRKLMEVLSMKNENDKVDHLQNQIREIEMRQKKLTSQIKQISKRHEYTSRKARTHYLIQLGAAVEHVYGLLRACLQQEPSLGGVLPDRSLPADSCGGLHPSSIFYIRLTRACSRKPGTKTHTQNRIAFA